MSTVMEGTVALPDGGHLAYDLAGEGPMLTMIHPGLWDRRTWDREFDAWTDRYRVLRYDVRGYGRSSRLTGASYSHARDLAVLLENVGIEQTSIVGCSMGGAIAVDFVLVEPTKVVSLVLAAAGLGGFEANEEENAWWEARMDPVEAAVEAGDLERAEDLRLEVWAPMGTDDAAGRRIREIAFDNIHELTMDESAEEELEPPAALRLGEIDVPTLVLVAEHDPPFIRRCDELIGREVLDGRLVTIDADHVVNVRNPDAFDAAVLPFLAEYAL
jgi:pimeloyl-ACP methyl ester carboxylesterase